MKKMPTKVKGFREGGKGEKSLIRRELLTSKISISTFQEADRDECPISPAPLLVKFQI
jgi:hypothetical protein